jgi:uncharacterized membrane protein YphA (DoxX/SURF4 family)
MARTEKQNKKLTKISGRIAIARIIFGLVWAVDAALKFEPSFYRDMVSTIKAGDVGEPGWLNPWFHVWYRLIGINPHLFAIIVIIIELLITVSLLLGVARRTNYLLGALFSFLIWSVAEGFGGPYGSDSTDIGAGFIYVIVFLALYAADDLSPARLSLDPLLEQHFSWWATVTNPSTWFARNHK